MMAEEAKACQEMTTKLEEHSAQVGLNIGLEKTKVMQITQRPSPQPIAVEMEIRLCRKIHVPRKCHI